MFFFFASPLTYSVLPLENYRAIHVTHLIKAHPTASKAFCALHGAVPEESSPSISTSYTYYPPYHPPFTDLTEKRSPSASHKTAPLG